MKKENEARVVVKQCRYCTEKYRGPGRPLRKCVCKTVWGFFGKTLQRNLISKQFIEEQKVGQFTFWYLPYLFFHWLNFCPVQS